MCGPQQAQEILRIGIIGAPAIEHHLGWWDSLQLDASNLLNLYHPPRERPSHLIEHRLGNGVRAARAACGPRNSNGWALAVVAATVLCSIGASQRTRHVQIGSQRIR